MYISYRNARNDRIKRKCALLKRFVVKRNFIKPQVCINVLAYM